MTSPPGPAAQDPQDPQADVVRAQPAAPTAGGIREDGTWVDSERPVDQPLLRDRQAQLEQQRHRNSLQSMLLAGLGALIVFTILVVFVGPWVGAVTEEFAQSIAQMVLPALLTFGGAIVGTLFTGSGNDSQKKI